MRFNLYPFSDKNGGTNLQVLQPRFDLRGRPIELSPSRKWAAVLTDITITLPSSGSHSSQVNTQDSEGR